MTKDITTDEDYIVSTRVETRSGHLGYPGQPGHVLSWSSRSDPVYEISGSDLDSILNHMQ